MELDRRVITRRRLGRIVMLAFWAVGAALVLAALNPVVAANQGIKIVDFAFQPSGVTVTAGEVVTWQNTGSTQHTVTADDGSFDSGVLSGGEQFAHLFDTVGTFAYHCSIHSTMTGTVTVAAAPNTPTPSGPSSPTLPPGTLPPNFSPHPAQSGAPSSVPPVAASSAAPTTPEPSTRPAAASSGDMLLVVGLIVLVAVLIAAVAWLVLRRPAA